MSAFDELISRKDSYFPLSECGCIYSPNVAIVRNVGATDARSGKLLPASKWEMISVVSCAAQVNYSRFLEIAFLIHILLLESILFVKGFTSIS